MDRGLRDLPAMLSAEHQTFWEVLLWSFLAVLYPWVKAAHVIAMVAWMAGLFYLPRLFVNHVEQAPIGSPLSNVFKGMEERLFRIIMRPAMMATWVFGLILLVTPGVIDWSRDLWIYVKLATVIGLTGFHEWLGARCRDFAADQNRISGRQWRLLNELPTVALVTIVTMVIVRPF